MAWNVILLIIVVLFMVLAFGGEYALTFSFGSDYAREIAPRLGVSEDRLRDELTKSLLESQDRRAVFRAAPFAFLALLLIARMIQEAAGRRNKP